MCTTYLLLDPSAHATGIAASSMGELSAGYLGGAKPPLGSLT